MRRRPEQTERRALGEGFVPVLGEGFGGGKFTVPFLSPEEEEERERERERASDKPITARDKVGLLSYHNNPFEI